MLFMFVILFSAANVLHGVNLNCLCILVFLVLNILLAVHSFYRGRVRL
jgi:hypothetical protein